MYLNKAASRPRLFIPLGVFCTLTAITTAQAEPRKPNGPAAQAAVRELFRIEVNGAKRSIARFYAITPDSKTLAYCDAEYYAEGKPPRCELVLIDLATGKELRRRRADDAYGGVFSPDGNLMAVGTPNLKTAATVWDVAAWEPKVHLERPDGHFFGCPLAFSADGKVVAGRVPRKPDHPSFREDLVIWDVATGACRVLEDGEARRLRVIPRRGVARGTLVPEGKDGAVDGAPRSGPPIVGFAPLAAAFADPPGSGQLVVEYNGFLTLWDTALGKAISTHIPGGSLDLGWLGAVGKPLVPPPTADLFRFRTTPRGRILPLPRYDAPPVIAYAEDNGNIVLAATPIEKNWGVRKTYNANFPLLELCRVPDYKGTTGGPTFALSPDGRRLVALGFDAGTEKTTTPTHVLRVWDVSAMHPIAAKKVQKLAGAERERLWAYLFDDWFTLQFQAMSSLVLHGEDAVPWLRDKMGPPIDVKKVPRLIVNIESDDFDTRERASRELERYGPLARSFLEAAIAKDSPPETLKRAGSLLKKLQATGDAYELRKMWLIDVLEHINTAAARELLQQIAEGKYDPGFAEEAKAALLRAGRRLDR